MSEWPAADTEQACQYLFDYWDRYPAEWAETNTTDNTTLTRVETWNAVNAATEGALALLVPDPIGQHWIFCYGIAVQAYWKNHL